MTPAAAHRSAYVRNAAARRAVYVLRGVWAPAECDDLAAEAAAAAAAAGGWCRARHASFPTPDIAADALQPQAADALRRAVHDRLLRPIAARCVAWPLRRARACAHARAGPGLTGRRTWCCATCS